MAAGKRISRERIQHNQDIQLEDKSRRRQLRTGRAVLYIRTGERNMTKWDHIIIEGYCTYSTASKKKWPLFEVGPKMQMMPAGTITNPSYINKSRPEWCMKKFPANSKSKKERITEYQCLNCQCPFFGYTNADDDDYDLFYAAFNAKLKQCTDNDGDFVPAHIDTLTKHILEFKKKVKE
jgi:hypothetical protein